MLDADATIAFLTEAPERTVLLSDFDGSLSAIVERAGDARPLPGVVELLAQLVDRFGRVGIVSGRPVDFLVEHLPVPGLSFTGLYGMEHWVDGHRTIDPRVVPYLDAVAEAVATVEKLVPAELIEPKSGVCVTLHWRPAPEMAARIVEVGETTAAQYGLAVLPTRHAIEIRPPVAIDKGDATRAAVAGFAVAMFAGDDRGDLPAFAALETAQHEGVIRRGVRVGVDSPELPPELAAAVDVLVGGPEALVALLGRVADEVA